MHTLLYLILFYVVKHLSSVQQIKEFATQLLSEVRQILQMGIDELMRDSLFQNVRPK